MIVAAKAAAAVVVAAVVVVAVAAVVAVALAVTVAAACSREFKILGLRTTDGLSPEPPSCTHDGE